MMKAILPVGWDLNNIVLVSVLVVITMYLFIKYSRALRRQEPLSVATGSLGLMFILAAVVGRLTVPTLVVDGFGLFVSFTLVAVGFLMAAVSELKQSKAKKLNN